MNEKCPVCLGQTFPSDEARRNHFLALLAAKLKDPAFRNQEGFPHGTDEAILAMSDPPYYTACPNPWLGDFIECYGKPYDPSVSYSREPLAVDVSVGKTDHHSPIQDLVQFLKFPSESEQYEWLVDEIRKNLEQDELRLSKTINYIDERERPVKHSQDAQLEGINEQFGLHRTSRMGNDVRPVLVGRVERDKID